MLTPKGQRTPEPSTSWQGKRSSGESLSHCHIVTDTSVNTGMLPRDREIVSRFLLRFRRRWKGREWRAFDACGIENLGRNSAAWMRDAPLEPAARFLFTTCAGGNRA